MTGYVPPSQDPDGGWYAKGALESAETQARAADREIVEREDWNRDQAKRAAEYRALVQRAESPPTHDSWLEQSPQLDKIETTNLIVSPDRGHWWSVSESRWYAIPAGTIRSAVVQERLWRLAFLDSRDNEASVVWSTPLRWHQLSEVEQQMAIAPTRPRRP